MSTWFSLPGPPLLVSKSQPYLLDPQHVERLKGYVFLNGAQVVTLKVELAQTTIDLIKFMKLVLEFPDWCGNSWDSVHDAFKELQAAWTFPLLILVEGADSLIVRHPQLALEAVVRLGELSNAFARVGEQLIVAHIWETATTSTAGNANSQTGLI